MWYTVRQTKCLQVASDKECWMEMARHADQKRILYVEDDLTLSATVVDILEDSGYIVDHVARGREALDHLMRQRPDLLLLDLGLPDIDGLEVCHLARRRTPDMGIIALTGRTDTADVLAGFAEGADDYIRKPFDLAVLLARISAVLRPSDQQDRGPVRPALGLP
jgi:DNA-binding response OmpR family regulator